MGLRDEEAEWFMRGRVNGSSFTESVKLELVEYEAIRIKVEWDVELEECEVVRVWVASLS